MRAVPRGPHAGVNKTAIKWPNIGTDNTGNIHSRGGETLLDPGNHARRDRHGAHHRQGLARSMWGYDTRVLEPRLGAWDQESVAPLPRWPLRGRSGHREITSVAGTSHPNARHRGRRNRGPQARLHAPQARLLEGSVLDGFWTRKSSADNSVRSSLHLRPNRRLNDTPQSTLPVSQKRGSETASATGMRRPIGRSETAIAVSIPTGLRPGLSAGSRSASGTQPTPSPIQRRHSSDPAGVAKPRLRRGATAARGHAGRSTGSATRRVHGGWR